MIAQNGQNAVDTFIHTFQTDWMQNEIEKLNDLMSSLLFTWTCWQFGVTEWWQSIVTPFYIRHPYGMAQWIGFQIVVCCSVERFVKFRCRFDGTESADQWEGYNKFILRVLTLLTPTKPWIDWAFRHVWCECVAKLDGTEQQNSKCHGNSALLVRRTNTTFSTDPYAFQCVHCVWKKINFPGKKLATKRQLTSSCTYEWYP